MIRIESNPLISFFQSEADKAGATGFPVLAAEHQCSADTFRDFAGKLFFFPHATPVVHYYSPLPALTAFSLDTIRYTAMAFADTGCRENTAQAANFDTMIHAQFPVDADGLTAID